MRTRAAHDIEAPEEVAGAETAPNSATADPHRWRFRILLGLILLLLISTAGLSYRSYQQATRIEMLYHERQFFSAEAASTSARLAEANESIAELEADRSRLRDELEELADDYRDERNRNEEFEDQLRDLAGTVGTLDRLAQIDEELLQKYSRVSFLNENYIPRKLVEIDEDLVHPSAGDEYFLEDAYPFLEDLMRDAARDDIDLTIVSAYRSFEYQTELKGQYLVTYGEGANQFSADQGFSEHQLGTSVDFSTPERGAVLDEGFAATEAYEWLLDNAHKHGFVLSYPEGNEFYLFEPWHWRFVGEQLARDLHEDDAYFYDWEQRTINEYLVDIFE